jgi:GH15 family glucan-1,4-alpha-glucosidase
MEKRPNPAPVPSHYRAIGDYALIGDGRTAALVSRDGSIDWLCLPQFSSPSVFGALLDSARGGRFRIRPVAPFRVERRYRDGSAVLETIFSTANGRVRLVDFLPLASGRHLLEPTRQLLRLIDGLAGQVELELLFEPRPDYGRGSFVLRPGPGQGVRCEHRNELFLLSADIGPIRPDERHAQARFTVRAGERRALALSYAVHAPAVVPPLREVPWEQAAATARWWRTWSERCGYRGPHWDEVLRSMITLKLLTYSLSGAVIAAPTASLPENPGGQRNWDYRYCWLRDAARTLEAFHYMGYRDEAEGFLGWLLHATRLTHPELQVLYSVFGEARIPEFTLDHLAGHGNARPVRIGNGAWQQLQLDVYGEVVDGAFYYVQSGGRLDRWEKNYLLGFGDVVLERWREPDNGMWEFRGPRRHFTFSKLMCWVVLDRLLTLHRQGHLRVRKADYERGREAIRRAIDTNGFSTRLNSYVGVFGSQWLDASLLLMPHHGYVRGDDPRMRGTYDCLRRHLGVGRVLYRYPPGSDDFPEPEGAFAACSFWAVDYLAHAGRIDEAEAEFEYLLSLGNDVGLFGEEFDADGAPLGNFPQAFTHAGIVTAAIAIERARKVHSTWQ